MSLSTRGVETLNAFTEVADTSTPEKTMWLYALIYGIAESIPGKWGLTQEERHLASLWVGSRSTHVGSFIWICDQLDLDPKWVRRLAKQWALRRHEFDITTLHVRRQS